MIKSFKCKETKRLFYRDYSRKLPFDIQRRAMMKLGRIHSAFSLEDLKVPLSNCLEQLWGYKEKIYSLRINKQWRICFKWKAGDAYDVEIIDYH